MSGDPRLSVRICRQVHAGLRLDASFELGACSAAIFGDSGAGKTSLLRLIAGLDRPDSGRVALCGETLFDSETRIHLPIRRRRIGMVFQDDRLFPHLDVAANIRFGLKGWPAADIEARVAEVAELCGVGHLLGRRPERLSGGERQRVGLARALAPRPRLLLCDEPVSAIDLDGRFALIERLKAVQRAESIPLLYVTHSPSEVFALEARVFRLAAGRIVDEGAPLDVLAATSNDLTGVLNTFVATVAGHDDESRSTRLQLPGGPALVVPYHGRAEGDEVGVSIRAEDILLARGPAEGLSARNVLPGTVERVVLHGPDAEVLVRTGKVVWMVSIVHPVVRELGLQPGSAVWLIIKARSCRVIDARA